MLNKIFISISIIFLNAFIAGCCKKAYIIDKDNLTYQGSSRLYLNIQEIGEIKKGKKTFILKGNQPVYIKSSEDLILKHGWTLIGHSGNEVMIKEQSTTTSAIRIKNAGNITIKNFHLKMDEYAAALEKSLIEIDNKMSGGKKIEIVNMKLSNHYSGVWIKRGNNILLDSCYIFDNGHQINLGFLPIDTSEIYKYKVNKVTIKNSEIRDGKPDGNINGIKTLSNCTGIKIINNLIANNAQDGIDLYPGGVDVLIKHNTIRDNGAHGIEVKMYRQYKPHQTGQIKNVLIDSNRIINNKFCGITCLDTIAIDYYAKGITISGNRIDSSYQYGVFSQLPVRIENNIFNNNGLSRNMIVPSLPRGYPGIYLLKGRPNDPSFVINNQIIDQASITGIRLTYWMVVTEAKSTTAIRNNRFHISDSSIYNRIDTYGVGLITNGTYTVRDSVKLNNNFSDYFKTKVVVQ